MVVAETGTEKGKSSRDSQGRKALAKSTTALCRGGKNGPPPADRLLRAGYYYLIVMSMVLIVH